MLVSTSSKFKVGCLGGCGFYCLVTRMKQGWLAEAVRFELTDPFESPVFKTGAIDHSATLPWG
ncbi:MAG: hypothetical protein RL659_2248 [Pseudomonadota bacterium]